MSGFIKNKSVLDCIISLKSAILGDINDLRIPCYVHNSTDPIFLDIKGCVKGVSVNYYFSDTRENE